MHGGREKSNLGHHTASSQSTHMNSAISFAGCELLFLQFLPFKNYSLHQNSLNHSISLHFSHTASSSTVPLSEGSLCPSSYFAGKKELKQETVPNTSKACKSLFARKGNIPRYSPSRQLSWWNQIKCPACLVIWNFIPWSWVVGKKNTQKNLLMFQGCLTWMLSYLLHHILKAVSSLPLPHAWVC